MGSGRQGQPLTVRRVLIEDAIQMKLGIDGKIALVTGASAGIGFAAAEALAREGAMVVITGRSADHLADAAARLRANGAEVEAVVADAYKANCGEVAVSAAIRRFGTLHILVNNVGTLDKLATFEELSDEDWENSFAINVMSAVRAIRAALPVMRHQKWGRIINLSSEAASHPDPAIQHYCATKAAISNLTKSLSKALACDGILVNTVSPGTIRTPLLHGFLQEMARERNVTVAEMEKIHLRDARPNVVLGRAGEASEIGSVITFLASEAASFITGAEVRVDGGSVASL